MWRPFGRKEAKPGKTSGVASGGEHLEDQDGVFACWCRSRDRISGPALAVSSYNVTNGAPCPQNDGSSLPAAESYSAEVIGSGFGIFADGLDRQIGGVLTRAQTRAGCKEASADRYLIHGLVAGPNFVAAYDSDLRLHVSSLAVILQTGTVLTAGAHPPARAAGSSLSQIGVMQAKRHKGGIDSAMSREDNAEFRTSSRSANQVILVNNDHGLIVTEHRGMGEHIPSNASPEEDLKLSITWRDASTGSETPDDEACTVRSGDNNRLPFLPGGMGKDGVIAADVRFGRFALFTTYAIVVCTRPRPDETSTTTIPSDKGHQNSAAEWRAYLGGSNTHGLLIGGAMEIDASFINSASSCCSC